MWARVSAAASSGMASSAISSKRAWPRRQRDDSAERSAGGVREAKWWKRRSGEGVADGMPEGEEVDGKSRSI